MARNWQQKKAIKELVDSGGKMTIAAAMRKAKYSENTIKTPKKLTESKAYKKEMKPIIERLEAERDAALTAMIKKRKDAKYSELNSATNDLTKTSQLLGGGATERIEITQEEREAVDKAFENNEL